MSNYWKDKIVLITGGSAGFGLELAKSLGREGCHVAIAARNYDRLESAAQQLRDLNIRVTTYVADVTDQNKVAGLADSIRDDFGRLDMLVNAAGKSTRGLAATTSSEKFEELWRINFLATVRCSQMFLPMLKETRGHLVNIGSLASKVGAANLGAYPASKFPVAAFCQQLRLEMQEPAAHVLLVCPGPIARNDAGSRYDTEADGDDLPESAKKPGGGAKLKQILPEKLATAIMGACVRRQSELVMPAKAKILFAIQQISPRLGDWLLRRKT